MCRLDKSAGSKAGKISSKEKKTESVILRDILDDYLKKPGKLKKQHFQKQQCIGLQRLARTIRKDQDIKLRKIAEETGMTISEVVRGALEDLSSFR